MNFTKTASQDRADKLFHFDAANFGADAAAWFDRARKQ